MESSSSGARSTRSFANMISKKIRRSGQKQSLSSMITVLSHNLASSSMDVGVSKLIDDLRGKPIKKQINAVLRAQSRPTETTYLKKQLFGHLPNSQCMIDDPGHNIVNQFKKHCRSLLRTFPRREKVIATLKSNYNTILMYGRHIKVPSKAKVKYKTMKGFGFVKETAHKAQQYMNNNPLKKRSTSSSTIKPPKKSKDKMTDTVKKSSKHKTTDTSVPKTNLKKIKTRFATKPKSVKRMKTRLFPSSDITYVTQKKRSSTFPKKSKQKLKQKSKRSVSPKESKAKSKSSKSSESSESSASSGGSKIKFDEKPSTIKPSTPKTSTTKSSAEKPSTAKASTEKPKKLSSDTKMPSKTILKNASSTGSTKTKRWKSRKGRSRSPTSKSRDSIASTSPERGRTVGSLSGFSSRSGLKLKANFDTMASLMTSNPSALEVPIRKEAQKGIITPAACTICAITSVKPTVMFAGTNLNKESNSIVSLEVAGFSGSSSKEDTNFPNDNHSNQVKGGRAAFLTELNFEIPRPSAITSEITEPSVAQDKVIADCDSSMDTFLRNVKNKPTTPSAIEDKDYYIYYVDTTTSRATFSSTESDTIYLDTTLSEENVNDIVSTKPDVDNTNNVATSKSYDVFHSKVNDKYQVDSSNSGVKDVFPLNTCSTSEESATCFVEKTTSVKENDWVVGRTVSEESDVYLVESISTVDITTSTEISYPRKKYTTTSVGTRYFNDNRVYHVNTTTSGIPLKNSLKDVPSRGESIQGESSCMVNTSTSNENDLLIVDTSSAGNEFDVYTELVHTSTSATDDELVKMVDTKTSNENDIFFVSTIQSNPEMVETGTDGDVEEMFSALGLVHASTSIQIMGRLKKTDNPVEKEKEETDPLLLKNKKKKIRFSNEKKFKMKHILTKLTK